MNYEWEHAVEALLTARNQLSNIYNDLARAEASFRHIRSTSGERIGDFPPALIPPHDSDARLTIIFPSANEMYLAIAQYVEYEVEAYWDRHRTIVIPPEQRTLEKALVCYVPGSSSRRNFAFIATPNGQPKDTAYGFGRVCLGSSPADEYLRYDRITSVESFLEWVPKVVEVLRTTERTPHDLWDVQWGWVSKELGTCVCGSEIDLENEYYVVCTEDGCSQEMHEDCAIYCADCEDELCDHHAHYIAGDSFVCRVCYEENYTSCNVCDTVVRDNDSYDCESCGRVLCEDCVYSQEVEFDVGNVGSLNTGWYIGYEVQLCESCYEDLAELQQEERERLEDEEVETVGSE